MLKVRDFAEIDHEFISADITHDDKKGNRIENEEKGKIIHD